MPSNQAERNNENISNELISLSANVEEFQDEFDEYKSEPDADSKENKSDSDWGDLDIDNDIKEEDDSEDEIKTDFVQPPDGAMVEITNLDDDNETSNNSLSSSTSVYSANTGLVLFDLRNSKRVDDTSASPSQPKSPSN